MLFHQALLSSITLPSVFTGYHSIIDSLWVNTDSTTTWPSYASVPSFHFCTVPPVPYVCHRPKRQASLILAFPNHAYRGASKEV